MENERGLWFLRPVMQWEHQERASWGLEEVRQEFRKRLYRETEMADSGTKLAPKGKIWVCLACGKKSRTQYGFDDKNKNVCDRGWDASCVINSQLFDKKRLVLDENGMVKEVKDDHAKAGK